MPHDELFPREDDREVMGTPQASSLQRDPREIRFLQLPITARKHIVEALEYQLADLTSMSDKPLKAVFEARGHGMLIFLLVLFAAVLALQIALRKTEIWLLLLLLLMFASIAFFVASGLTYYVSARRLRWRLDFIKEFLEKSEASEVQREDEAATGPNYLGSGT